MYSVIAHALYQKKKCTLPGLGELLLETVPAQTNFIDSFIVAPTSKILFSSSIDKDKIFNEFSAISEVLIGELDEKKEVEVEGLGRFFKKADGYGFEAIALKESYFSNVEVIRVKREDALHDILVGDTQTTNVRMNEYFAGSETIKKDWWWVIPLVLGAAAMATIVYTLYKNGFNNFGNIAP
jgi:hypothetical protein